MPTPPYMSPHRVLPLILAVPLLLLLGAAGSTNAPGPHALSPAAVPERFEPHELPVGWGDDVLQDALPSPPADDDDSGRRLRAARAFVERKPPRASPISRSLPGVQAASAVDSLLESLLSGRPPPVAPE